MEVKPLKMTRASPGSDHDCDAPGGDRSMDLGRDLDAAQCETALQVRKTSTQIRGHARRAEQLIRLSRGA